MADAENVCPQAWGGALGGLAREVRRLAARPPPGAKVLVREEDLREVTALLEGPADTPYSGGVFVVRLRVGATYPAAPPRAVFATRIFHPNVSAAGEVCVNTLARDWRPELGLAHALLAVRCLLIAPNPDSALNAEAAALLQHNYTDYFARAKLYTEIHARKPPAAAAAAAGAHHHQEATGSGGEGPSAKRERRPAGAAAAGAAGRASGSGRERDKRRILKRL